MQFVCVCLIVSACINVWDHSIKASGNYMKSTGSILGLFSFFSFFFACSCTTTPHCQYAQMLSNCSLPVPSIFSPAHSQIYLHTDTLWLSCLLMKGNNFNCFCIICFVLFSFFIWDQNKTRQLYVLVQCRCVKITSPCENKYFKFTLLTRNIVFSVISFSETCFCLQYF